MPTLWQFSRVYWQTSVNGALNTLFSDGCNISDIMPEVIQSLLPFTGGIE
jgi:hypothetical protein